MDEIEAAQTFPYSKDDFPGITCIVGLGTESPRCDLVKDRIAICHQAIPLQRVNIVAKYSFQVPGCAKCRTFSQNQPKP
jgi:hypothetical protein